MRLKHQYGRRSQNADENGVAEWTAEQLVEWATTAPFDIGGQVECVHARVELLANIVGRMVARMPERQWLEITGLQYEFKELK